MILIISSSSDPVAKYFAQYLFNHRFKFLYIAQELLGTAFILKSNNFFYKKSKFNYSEFSGVYVRLGSPSHKLKSLYPNIESELSILINIINTKFSNIVNTTVS